MVYRRHDDSNRPCAPDSRNAICSYGSVDDVQLPVEADASAMDELEAVKPGPRRSSGGRDSSGISFGEACAVIATLVPVS